FVREALVNYLALLGWSTGTEEEVLSLPELVERFDIRHVQKAGAVFDRERLEWLNGQWIRRLPPEELIDRLRTFLEAELDPGGGDTRPRAAGKPPTGAWLSAPRCPAAPRPRRCSTPWSRSATSEPSSGWTAPSKPRIRRLRDDPRRHPGLARPLPGRMANIRPAEDRGPVQ